MLGERRPSHEIPLKTDTETLAGKPQPRDDTQINRNWLNSWANEPRIDLNNKVSM